MQLGTPKPRLQHGAPVENSQPPRYPNGEQKANIIFASRSPWMSCACASRLSQRAPGRKPRRAHRRCLHDSNQILVARSIETIKQFCALPPAIVAPSELTEGPIRILAGFCDHSRGSCSLTSNRKTKSPAPSRVFVNRLPFQLTLCDFALRQGKEDGLQLV